MSKLAIANIGCVYGSFTAVHDFSLDIAPGEFVSLLGPSGCGKTTMLRMIAGFVSPTRGTITLNGKVISSAQDVLPPEQRGMSMIFQSYAIWPNMTVFQNVAFGLELRRIPTAEIRKKVLHMLDVVQLGQQAERYPAELSGGQQQRVALARAVVVEPEVLLLDEPLSNLDANLREEMRLEIRRMHDEFKITTVYVTHDQAEAMVASDRIVVMRAGRIEQVDTPQKLYRAPRTKFVASFIGRTNFLSGRRNGSVLDFEAFSLPLGSLPAAAAERADAVVAIRPHSIRLAKAGTGATAARLLLLQGQIAERAYFGDHWDYTVRISDRTRLVVSVEPRHVCNIGDAVALEIDQDEISVIMDDAGAAENAGS